MKNFGKRILSLGMALCLCASMSVQTYARNWISDMTMSATAQEQKDGTYEVTYQADLTMAEELAQIATVNRDAETDLKSLRFFCTLTDGLADQMTKPKQEDFVFSGPGAENYTFDKISHIDGGLQIVYKLNHDKVKEWQTGSRKDSMTAAEVKAELMRPMAMTSTQTVTAEQLNKAMTNGQIASNGKVEIKRNGGGNIPGFGITTIKTADVDILVTINGCGEGGNGSGSGFKDCPRDETCPIWPFTDASTKAWYHDGVHYCLDEKIMKGFPGLLFKPNLGTTRAMVVAMLYNKEHTPAVEYKAVFDDVKENAWYADAVIWASNEQIVKGYGDGNFGPDDVVTREQMASIFRSYSAYKGVDVTIDEASIILTQGDVDEISAWAMTAMKWAVHTNLMKGEPVPGSSILMLNPKGETTRAQTAQMFKNYLVK